jgi:hypothetical protein
VHALPLHPGNLEHPWTLSAEDSVLWE